MKTKRKQVKAIPDKNLTQWISNKFDVQEFLRNTYASSDPAASVVLGPFESKSKAQSLLSKIIVAGKVDFIDESLYTKVYQLQGNIFIIVRLKQNSVKAITRTDLNLLVNMQVAINGIENEAADMLAALDKIDFSTLPANKFQYFTLLQNNLRKIKFHAMSANGVPRILAGK